MFIRKMPTGLGNASGRPFSIESPETSRFARLVKDLPLWDPSSSNSTLFIL